MIYLLILLSLIVMVYVYDYRKIEAGKTLCRFLILCIFILVVGLRYRIGTDSIRYESYFESYPTIWDMNIKVFQTSRFSPLYVFFNILIKSITDNFFIFQLIHATILNTIVFYFLFRNTSRFFLGLTFYYVFLYLNLNTEVLRESLAISVFLLAWPFFRDGKWLYWYAMSIIAFFFHVSATMMFFLPLVMVPGIRSLFVFGRRTIIICVAIFIGAIAIQSFFFKYIQALIVLESVSERAKTYSENITYGTSNLNIAGFIGSFFRFVLYPLIALFFLYMKKKMEGYRRFKTNKVEKLTLMSIYVAIFASIIPIVGRFNNYLFFFAILTICNFAFSYLPLNKKLVRFKFPAWLILFIPLFAFQIYSAYFANANRGGSLKVYSNYYPYTTVLDAEKDQAREKVFRYNNAY